MTFIDKWNRLLGHMHEYSDRRGAETAPGRMQWLDDRHDLLEIGCGIGHALAELKSKGKKVVGLDIAPSNAQEASRRYGLEVLIGDMHDLPFDDSAFDGALAWDVFEHSLAPFLVLVELNRVLKLEGKLLIYIPPLLWQDHCVHTIVPTEDQMKDILNKTGFKVDKVVRDLNQGLQYEVIKVGLPALRE